jgi:2,3-bisphosphoglycerate-independent phosphoglycerate mutase
MTFDQHGLGRGNGLTVSHPDDDMVRAMPSSIGRPRPLVLVIMDGFGERAETADNRVRTARTADILAIRATFPRARAGTSAPAAGSLPGEWER